MLSTSYIDVMNIFAVASLLPNERIFVNSGFLKGLDASDKSSYFLHNCCILIIELSITLYKGA